MAFHPDVEAVLERGRHLADLLSKVKEAAFDDRRVRRSAEREPNLLPEINGYGALTDLWMEGIVGRYTAPEIERIFMEAMSNCYEALGDPLAEAVRALGDDELLAPLTEQPGDQAEGDR